MEINIKFGISLANIDEREESLKIVNKENIESAIPIVEKRKGNANKDEINEVLIENIAPIFSSIDIKNIKQPSSDNKSKIPLKQKPNIKIEA